MKIRKIILIAIIGVMIVSVFGGCGANGGSKNGNSSLTDDVIKNSNAQDQKDGIIRGKANSISISDYFIVGLKTDGTVVAVGGNSFAENYNVDYWEDIIAVSAGTNHIVGLKSDGQVVATGYNKKRQCAVYGWTDIVDIHAGHEHTYGLKSDGTVVMTTESGNEEYFLKGWNNVVSLEGIGDYVFGLTSDGMVYMRGKEDPVDSDIKGGSVNAFCSLLIKNDGTVIARSNQSSHVSSQYDGLEKWTDIIDVSTYAVNHAVGLKSDGTAVAVGQNDHGQCNVSDWDDIVSVATGSYHTVGLKSNGTVVATGHNGYKQCEVSNWKNIVAIFAGDTVTVGLKDNGTVVATGVIWEGLGNIHSWKNIEIN